MSILPESKHYELKHLNGANANSKFRTFARELEPRHLKDESVLCVFYSTRKYDNLKLGERARTLRYIYFVIII